MIITNDEFCKRIDKLEKKMNSRIKKDKKDLEKIKDLYNNIRTVKAFISSTNHTFYEDRVNIIKNIENKIAIINRRMEKRND